VLCLTANDARVVILGSSATDPHPFPCRIRSASAPIGALIAEFMDAENTMWGTSAEGIDGRERIRGALGKEGLSYSRGGHLHGAALSGPSRSLARRSRG
jgi:hypothetical protein